MRRCSGNRGSHETEAIRASAGRAGVLALTMTNSFFSSNTPGHRDLPVEQTAEAPAPWQRHHRQHDGDGDKVITCLSGGKIHHRFDSTLHRRCADPFEIVAVNILQKRLIFNGMSPGKVVGVGTARPQKDLSVVIAEGKTTCSLYTLPVARLVHRQLNRRT